MSLLKLVSFFLLFAFNFAAIEAYDPVFLGASCSSYDAFVPNSAFRKKLQRLRFSLSIDNDDTSTFNNATDGVGPSTNDTVYGLFMCRGDVPPQLCQDCVSKASYRIVPQCAYSQEGIIYYEECLVRYSGRHSFSTPDDDELTISSLMNSVNTSNQKSYSRVLNKTLGEAVEAAVGVTKKFAVKEANFSKLETLYVLAQCIPLLSTQGCYSCLHQLLGEILSCCVGRQGADAYTPSCSLRFELYRFYYKDNTAPQVPPSSGSGPTEAQPVYLNLSCSGNKTFNANSDYPFELKTLLSFLYSNATGNTRFYNTTVAGRNPFDTVYGLFMCRGDVSPEVCHQCVGNATQRLSSKCRLSKEAIIWYDVCLLRYSNHSFFSTFHTMPKFILSTVNDSEEDLEPDQQQDCFEGLLEITLKEVVAEAAKPGPAGAKKFAIDSKTLDFESETLYSLAECTPDLSSQDCHGCLREVLEDIKMCCLGKQGGRVMYPSCYLRFELYEFYYNNGAAGEAPAPSPSPTPVVYDSGSQGKAQGQSRNIIIVVVLVVSVILFCLACYFLRRRKSKKAILKENFGSESTTLESLQFSLATIEAATNKFSHENKIGKGGFGEVYKGVLFDGRKIAVKKLSKSSGQGVIEFKNEILLIAKLQHRNLVALLGFCLEEQEKILVYEYVPNKSLDYFLFGSQERRVLNWLERYKIIRGIAGGILYLHKFSRLKVIHRDLKPSNILLDDEMSPKISDFGMAKIIAINETEGSTNRIVGTYGYMSPEYVTIGQFSEKSDLFSFGVIVLEIATGKKNLSRHDSQYVNGLLSYAWKQWRDERLIEIVDSKLTEVASQSEIIRFIQIGLLCVQENPNARPSMVNVVQYLSNDSIQLPFPQEPAFFMHGGKEPTIGAMESGFGQHSNNSKPCSNEISLSKFFPR